MHRWILPLFCAVVVVGCTSSPSEETNTSASLSLALPDVMPAVFDANGPWDATISANFSEPSGNEDEDSMAPVLVTQMGPEFSIELDAVAHVGFVNGATYFVSFRQEDADGVARDTFIEFTLSTPMSGVGTIRWIDDSGAIGGGDLVLTR